MRLLPPILLYSLSLLSVNILSGQVPTKPQATLEELEQKLQQAKDIGERFSLQGKILAAAPERIPEALPKLLETASGFKAGEYYVAALLAPCAKESVPTLIKMLEKEDPNGRYWVVQQGLEEVLSVARPALIDVLANHKSMPVRIRAAQILGRDRAEDKSPAVAALTKHLTEQDAALRIEAALALVNLQPASQDAIAVLKQDFAVQTERILRIAWRYQQPEPWREVLLLGLAHPDNRAWRAESALVLVGLDGKWTAATHHAAIDGLFVDDRKHYNLSARVAAALGKHPEFKEKSIAQLERVCESNDSLNLVAAASVALLRLDPEQAELRLPAILAAVVRPGYLTSKEDFLLAIGELGERASFAEPTLAKTLTFERDQHCLLTALVCLQLKPAKPEIAVDILREGLQGKMMGSGRTGLRQFQLPTAGLEPLFPEVLNALDSKNLLRVRLALQLLKVSGPAAKPLVPELAKRTLAQSVDQELKDLVKTLSAAQ